MTVGTERDEEGIVCEREVMRQRKRDGMGGVWQTEESEWEKETVWEGGSFIQWKSGLKSRRHHKRQRQTTEAILSAKSSLFEYKTIVLDWIMVHSCKVNMFLMYELSDGGLPQSKTISYASKGNQKLKNPFNIHPCYYACSFWARLNHYLKNCIVHTTGNNHCYKTACCLLFWLTVGLEMYKHADITTLAMILIWACQPKRYYLHVA